MSWRFQNCGINRWLGTKFSLFSHLFVCFSHFCVLVAFRYFATKTLHFRDQSLDWFSEEKFQFFVNIKNLFKTTVACFDPPRFIFFFKLTWKLFQKKWKLFIWVRLNQSMQKLFVKNIFVSIKEPPDRKEKLNLLKPNFFTEAKHWTILGFLHLCNLIKNVLN